MTGAPVLRTARPADMPALRQMWMEVFGDPAAYVDGFFRELYTPGAAIAAEVERRVVSAVYLLPIGEAVLPDGRAWPCTVSYAFATLAPYRGRGYGEAVARAAVERSFGGGSPVNTICPAEDSLFGYYSRKVGYQDCFFAYERVLQADEIGPGRAGWGITPVSGEKYGEIREKLLTDRFHIRFSSRALAYQAKLCEEGGGLFGVSRGGQDCCVAAERQDETHVLIKELLAPADRVAEVLAAVAAAVPAGTYTLRMPAEAPQTPGVRRFAMLRTAPELQIDAGAKLPWYGFAFD